MPADIGSQTISLKYYSPGNSREINERFVDTRPTGIYSGGILSIVDSSHASLSPVVCEIGDGTHQVRVETTTDVSVTVAQSTPYVVLRWAYTGDTTDYMEILALGSGNIQSNDLIVAKCTFTGGGSLNGFSYGDSTYPRSSPNVQDLWLKVIPISGSLSLRVLPGYYQAHTQQIHVPLQQTSALVPPSSDSKIYLIYVDEDTGTINVDSSGTAQASPVAPDYVGRLVLAEVTLQSTDTSITADMIRDVRPFLTHGRCDIDDTTITTDSDGKLKTVDKKYLVLQDDNTQVSSQSSWTKITFDNEVKSSGISQSSGVVTLLADVMYKISYNVTFEYVNDLHGEARIRVLSGDLSWEFRDDDNNVSFQKVGELSTLANDIEFASLSGTYIIIPSSTTTLQLEAKTSAGGSTGKVIRSSLSIWT